jgi:hypothetical protein
MTAMKTHFFLKPFATQSVCGSITSSETVGEHRGHDERCRRCVAIVKKRGLRSE